MGLDITLYYLQKIPKKELSLGFDNLGKPEYLDMHIGTNGSVTNGGINAKFSNEMDHDRSIIHN